MTELSNISYLSFLKRSGVSCFLQENPNVSFSKNTGQRKERVEFKDINNIDDLLYFEVYRTYKNCKKKYI